jgi:pyruvate/2-oxoglutarate dehydrogenase complex dihydrolipoamide dehydrogenase (E3) component
MKNYDAIVIGSGQAGSPLSYKLADQGWTVALVEKANLGGTCINTGCTPTKTMIASAQVAHYVRQAAKWGVRASNVSVDLPAIVGRKNKVVESFRGGHQSKIDQRKNMSLYRGQARFLAPRRIQVGEEELESERIFINTGTRPLIPKIDGLDQIDYLTNASLMELRELPEHLIVIGGGYIGLEFGQMFYRFGSQVTVVHKGEHLLAREDNDVADELQKTLEAEGMKFVMSADTQRVEKKDGKIHLTVGTPGGTQTLVGSHLLVATGRIPNADDLGLDKAGIERDPRGFVKVNNKLETNVKGVWALGDVKGGPAFTHISYNDYQILWANIVEGKNLTIDNRYLPYCAFTDPQVGRVGVTETEARSSGRKLKVGKIPMSYVARAIERDETAGFMKVVVDAETDRILGAAILGIEGGELVQLLGALMLADAPYTVFKGAVYTHPTLAEGFFSLMEAVQPV